MSQLAHGLTHISSWGNILRTAVHQLFSVQITVKTMEVYGVYPQCIV